jgi:hypothetical protein
MSNTPDVVHIDVMLMEYAALCYQRAMGKCNAEEVDNYRLKIVEQVQLIHNTNNKDN